MRRGSKCKGPEAGACFACLGNSKAVSVADVDEVMRRVAGVEDRIVARGQITLRDGKPSEIFKQRIQVSFCSCHIREQQRILGSTNVPISLTCQGKICILFRNVHFYSIGKQLLLNSYVVSLSKEWVSNKRQIA